MKVLIIGGGGREHALAWKCAQSPRVTQVIVAPGNAGTALEPKVRNVDIPADDTDALLEFAIREDIALTVVGPEGPLVAGIVDRFAAAGRACFGPSRAAARLEGSKAFTKEFLRRHRIPTASYATFDKGTFDPSYIRAQRLPRRCTAPLSPRSGPAGDEHPADTLSGPGSVGRRRFRVPTRSPEPSAGDTSHAPWSR